MTIANSRLLDNKVDVVNSYGIVGRGGAIWEGNVESNYGGDNFLKVIGSEFSRNRIDVTVSPNEICPSESGLGVVEERSKKHRIVVENLGGFKSLFLKMFDT